MAKPLRDANAPANVIPASNRTVSPEDNRKAEIEAAKVQLLSYVSKINKAEGELLKLNVPVSAKKAEIAELFRWAKKAGFERADLRELLNDFGQGKNSRDIVEREQTRRTYRDWLGLPTGDTAMDLFGDSNTPEEVKDEAHWRANGYIAGMRGDDGTPPDICPPRFIGAWTEGWGDGQRVIAQGLATPKVEPNEPVL